MALRFRKRNVKKTMYYVWFLGADESHAVRGSRYVLPIIDDMIERERCTRNIRKVTLEVSHKGLKIVQNIFNDNSGTDVVEIIQATSQSKVIKHLIPHNALTYVYQENTIVAVIFVISTATSAILAKWPIYVHVYRCDCDDTAILLKSQLQKLIDKPENQRQISELESKVQQHQPTTNITRTDSTPAYKSGNVFDSLAEELKVKLTGISQVPLLLPPRDYDTVHRQKGNFHDIESRRCSNTNIVGGSISSFNNETKQNLKRINSSIESSGIGSDNSGSPQSSESFFNTSDDDEWNADTSESLIYLLQPQKNLQQKVKKQYYFEQNRNDTALVTHTQRIQPKIIDHTKRKPLFFNTEQETTPQTSNDYYDVIISPQDRFKDAKEKFERLAQQQQLFKRPPKWQNINNNNNKSLTDSNSNAAYRKSFYYNDHYNNIVGDEPVIVDRQRNRQRQRYSYAEAPVSKYYYH